MDEKIIIKPVFKGSLLNTLRLIRVKQYVKAH